MSDNSMGPLFEDFPDITSEQWKEKIIADLKGADFDRKLVWKSPEGFNVQPYYRREDLESLQSSRLRPAEYPFTRGVRTGGNPWTIQQDFRLSGDHEKDLESIALFVERGAGAVELDARSIKSVDPAFLDALFTRIDPTKTYIHFSGIVNAPDLFRQVLSALERSGRDPERLKGSLGADPYGDLTLTGTWDEEAIDALTGLIPEVRHRTPNFSVVAIRPEIFQNGGSTLVQELAFGLAMAADLVEKLVEKGMAPGDAARAIRFTFATGSSYFMEIAKFRAARWLWSAICKEWQIPDTGFSMQVHARTASWNLTIYDPFVNILRATTEAMSATLGGIDSLSVRAHDSLYKDPNLFSSRIARNIQVILKEEAWFGKVSDPAAGSYYIEQLTSDLAGHAWQLFLQTINEGGFAEAFSKGSIQEKVNASMEEKMARVASRRDTVLGVNQFPNVNEMVLEQFSPGISRDTDAFGSIRPLGQFRAAEAFEALRIQTEKSGKRPKFFLLKYGDPAWVSARANFAANFFGCAGYELIDQPRFESLEAGIQKAVASRAEITVLCSADDTYSEMAPPVLKALKEASTVVVAGYPKDTMDELKSAGINHFIHVKSNLLEELTKYNELLGIE